MLFAGLPNVSPFRLNAGLEDVFVHAAWEAAERQIVAALVESSHVLVVAPSGHGKSLLLRAVSHALVEGGVSVCLMWHWHDAVVDFDADLVIADEIASAPNDVLWALYERETPVLFAGLPGSEAMMAQEIGLIGTVGLGPLDSGSTAAFIARRLERAKRPADTFTPDALAAIARRSEGVFRTMSLLAGAALFLADLRRSAQVTFSDVEEAAAMRSGLTQPLHDMPEAAPRQVQLELALS